MAFRLPISYRQRKKPCSVYYVFLSIPVALRRQNARRWFILGKIRREVSAGKVLVEEVSAVKSLSVSVRRQKAFRQKVLREQAAGQTGLRRPFFSAKNRKRYFCLLYPRREAAAVSSRKMQLGWFCRTEAGHMGVTSPFTAFLTASAFDAPVAIRTIFFAFIMDCMPIVSA